MRELRPRGRLESIQQLLRVKLFFLRREEGWRFGSQIFAIRFPSIHIFSIRFFHPPGIGPEGPDSSAAPSSGAPACPLPPGGGGWEKRGALEYGVVKAPPAPPVIVPPQAPRHPKAPHPRNQGITTNNVKLSHTSTGILVRSEVF